MPPRKMGFFAILLFWKHFSCRAQSVFIAQIEDLINFRLNSVIPSKIEGKYQLSSLPPVL